ncbi:MAG: elongation factor P [Candidatus Omnitrophica bacterium]|nr:elongation factor P [Candidatus Omnitrophota bacterium]
MLTANELKRKDMIIIDADPYQVIEVNISVPSARGASTMVKLKVKHLLNRSVQDKNFKAGEKFKEADVSQVEANYLYKDANGYCFMDQQTFEMLELPASLVEDYAWCLYEQLEVKIMLYNGAPVSIELPQYVNLKVAEAEHSAQLAGAAGGGTKNAVLETGKTVKVPQYISAGETVRVNTETGEVAGRA